MLKTIKHFILRDLVLEVKDIRSYQHLKSLHPEYVPWTGASIHPTALLYLLNDITIHRRNHIVECGSGISTIYIASLIKQSGRPIKFHSIDHDTEWLSLLETHLKKHQLEDQVKLIHAPLADCPDSLNGNCKWYDTDSLNPYFTEPTIDLLFIDGPPANKKNREFARYPALPFFRSRLGTQYSIILDDATRKGEQKICTKWKETCGLRFRTEILSGNISIASEGNRFNVL